MIYSALFGLISQILGDPRQIHELGFSFSFCKVGAEITSRTQGITSMKPLMADWPNLTPSLQPRTIFLIRKERSYTKFLRSTI